METRRKIGVEEKLFARHGFKLVPGSATDKGKSGFEFTARKSQHVNLFTASISLTILAGMSSPFDASDFVDSDFQSARTYAAPTGEAVTAASAPAVSNRPPTREEIESMVSEKQIKLAELRRAQEELERERAGLEELRRRQMEFQTGREEMLQHLTRGIGLLEESELNTRRDAEQMARTLGEFRDAASKVQSINEQTWSRENLNVELTRALTTIENARMEWNSARLKFPTLSATPGAQAEAAAQNPEATNLAALSFTQLLKLGFALTWPLALLGLGIFAVVLLRH